MAILDDIGHATDWHSIIWVFHFDHKITRKGLMEL